jgi:Bacterial Ig-like domain (group 3)
MLYAAIPASATQNPNTIISINPTTGAMATPIPVSTDPQRLAISDDGSELYVATSAGVLQRLNLKTLAIEKTFNLPVDSEWGQTYVQEMHVMPGSPQSIVVELFANVDPFEDGAALYNNSGLVNWLPGEVPTKNPLKMDSFTFTSPSAIYGLPMNSAFFTQVQVSPTGLSFSGGLPGETSQVNGSIVRSDGTLLYTNAGQVWNPTTQKLLGTYLEPSGSQLFYAGAVVPDTSDGKTYFLDSDATYAQEQALNIDVYDQTSYALLGTVPFLSIYPPDAIDLVRWGTNGFAFRSTDTTGSQPSANQIVVVTSNLIASTSGAPIPILSAVSPSSVNAGGPAYTMQLTGSGFTNASTVLVNGNSRATTYVSATSLTAQVLASDIAIVGQFDVQVSTPALGGGVSDYVVVSVTAPAKTAPTLVVTPLQTSLTTAQPLTVTVAVSGGTGKPVPTGTVILAGGGYTSAGASLSSGSTTINIPANSLSTGTDTLTVTYTPDSASASIYTTATQLATVSVTSPIGTTAVTITVTPSATSITNLQTDGVTVTLAGASGEAMPTGTVTLASAGYNASQPLMTGAASFTIPAGTLSSGTNTLTATYTGDAIYAGASGTTTVTISQLVITAPAPTPVSPGTSATTNVTLTAGSSYSGTMNLACTLTTAPAGAQSLPTCSLNPAGVAIAAGGAGTTMLTVNTTAASTTASMHRFQQHMFGFGRSGAALAVVLLFGIPFRRRRWPALAILLCAMSTAAMVGCGASGGSGTPPVTTGVPATSAGAYTFTVTGTDSVNSKITVSSVVTITVQ